MTPAFYIATLGLIALLLACSCAFLLIKMLDTRAALQRSKLISSELEGRIERTEETLGAAVVKYYDEQTGPLFENAPHWTPDDAAALSSFFKTNTGQTLTKRFQVVAGNQAVMGCQDEMHTTYAAANANGWNEACQWFLKLSRVTGAQVATKDEQAPEGEAQLLERFSP